MRTHVKGSASVIKGAVAAIAGLAIMGVAASAHAGEGRWKRGHFGPPGYVPGYVMVPPGHVRYYAPPVYYAPPPVVYATPVVAYPAPAYYSPGYLSLGVNIPLP